MNNFLKLIFAFTLMFAILTKPVYCFSFDIKIDTPPREGDVVSSWVSISGIAILPSSYHLWVLVSYGSNRDLWWPIGEANIDSQSRRWRISVPIGGPRDVGTFFIAVGPVDENENRRLHYHLRQSGGKADYGPRPIRIPMFSSPPVYRTVIKR
jgi:hypothetical protein